MNVCIVGLAGPVEEGVLINLLVGGPSGLGGAERGVDTALETATGVGAERVAGAVGAAPPLENGNSFRAVKSG